jgi:hypothetical protein
MEMDEKEYRGFLKDEYLLLQNQYEDYDRRSLTIKGWVGTGAIAATALAFSTSYPAALVIPVFVFIFAAIFWYLEACWKLFQYAISDRIRVIEAHFRNDPDILIRNPPPFQIYHFWYKSFTKDEPIFEYEKAFRPKSRAHRLFEAALQGFVMILYVSVMVLSVVSFVLLRFRLFEK